jgi:hypothetical protein
MIGGDFRRQKPREISTLSATTDTDGNTIASGMKARYLTDGYVYKFNGSTWSRPTPPETVDVPFRATHFLKPWRAARVSRLLTGGPRPEATTPGTTFIFNMTRLLVLPQPQFDCLRGKRFSFVNPSWGHWKTRPMTLPISSLN